ncbi:MAG: nucleotidyltransferase domain-containing protein [Phycisphaerae bacterium]|nr:nucleotidyltransferase domain-containing protein [Phycisphaerae bacterium]
MTSERDNLPAILPVGTAVVTRGESASRKGPRAAGAMGVIVRAPADPEHSYRVRFPGGEEVSLRRGEFEVLKQYLDPGRSRDRLAECDLRQYVIYRCVIGSRAYGLATDESDVDRRGVYLPPAELHWSLYGVPEQIEDQDADECYWELQKFLVLALKANPNILEVLHTPLVEHVTPLGQELLDMRGAFLSKLVYQTYNAYVMSQFKKLERDLRNQGRIKWKHAMHLVRLLLSGIGVLRTGAVPVEVTEHKDRLIAIRDGRTPWSEVNEWRLSLHKEFDEAFRTTALPDRPDYEAANAFLVRARRSMAR